MQLVFNNKANLSRNHCLSNLSANRVTTHRSQIGMSTAVNMTIKALCKGTMPFCCVYTYLMPSSPCNNFSCSCTPCVLYWLPQGTILVNSCNSGDKCNCQNNKCFIAVHVTKGSTHSQSFLSQLFQYYNVSLLSSEEGSSCALDPATGHRELLLF